MQGRRDPVEVMNPESASPFVLLCEHASNWIPAEYRGLGLTESDLVRHVAWDIGAADVARDLARRLDAPLVLAGASRLLIDLNRPLGSATSIPLRSEATEIPGNAHLTAAERALRAERWFHPFHDEVGRLLNRRQARALPTRVVAIHSFTPVFLGVARPWRAGILYREAAGFASRLIEGLGGEAAAIAHNQPYQIEDDSDFTVPVHGAARGLDAVLVEIRQDLVATPEATRDWAAHLETALRGAV